MRLKIDVTTPNKERSRDALPPCEFETENNSRCRTPAMSLWVLASVLIVAASQLRSWRSRSPRLVKHAKVGTERAPGEQPSSIDEMRALIRELEVQIEAQRDQLQKTEAILRRARAILTDLERDQQPAEPISA